MSITANKFACQFHTELNPIVWDSGNLREEIRDKLLEIAAAFIDFIEIELDVEDITLTGSLANYTYTNYSDFDLHILTNFKEYKATPDLLRDYFNAKKTIWNTTRDITIKGFEVELYVQNITDPYYSSGVYSLKDNMWLVEPKSITNLSEIDTRVVKAKVESLKGLIDYAISPECGLECAEKTKQKVLNTRKAGLEACGELSPENLAYKELRRSGDIDRLMRGVLAKKDAALSLRENFKSYSSLPSKRGPRHQSLTAGINAMTKADGKSVGMIAKSHTDKETPFPKIERLKSKEKGIIPLTPQEVKGIAAFYNLDLEKIKVQPRGLSTSGIKIAYNPIASIFTLTK